MSDPPKTPMKIIIRDVLGFASWKWVANDEICGICQFPFVASCPDCNYPGERCRIMKGRCTHAFHMHCLVKWLSTPEAKTQCPICRQQWRMLK